MLRRGLAERLQRLLDDLIHIVDQNKLNMLADLRGYLLQILPVGRRYDEIFDLCLGRSQNLLFQSADGQNVAQQCHLAGR